MNVTFTRLSLKFNFIQTLRTYVECTQSLCQGVTYLDLTPISNRVLPPLKHQESDLHCLHINLNTVILSHSSQGDPFNSTCSILGLLYPSCKLFYLLPRKQSWRLGTPYSATITFLAISSLYLLPLSLLWQKQLQKKGLIWAHSSRVQFIIVEDATLAEAGGTWSHFVHKKSRSKEQWLLSLLFHFFELSN